MIPALAQTTSLNDAPVILRHTTTIGRPESRRHHHRTSVEPVASATLVLQVSSDGRNDEVLLRPAPECQVHRPPLVVADHELRRRLAQQVEERLTGFLRRPKNLRARWRSRNSARLPTRDAEPSVRRHIAADRPWRRRTPGRPILGKHVHGGIDRTPGSSPFTSPSGRGSGGGCTPPQPMTAASESLAAVDVCSRTPFCRSHAEFAAAQPGCPLFRISCVREGRSKSRCSAGRPGGPIRARLPERASVPRGRRISQGETSWSDSERHGKSWSVRLPHWCCGRHGRRPRNSTSTPATLGSR